MIRRVLICGGRRWKEERPIWNVLRTLDLESDVVIHGAAPGADRIAGRLARARGLAVLEFPADWERYPKTAGHIRNRLMLQNAKPTEVWAFKREFDHALGRGGTENMVKLARAAGLPVTVVSDES